MGTERRVAGVVIEDTFAEAFAMSATRLIITAMREEWAEEAARSLTGFATSVIGCGVEAGVERRWDREETPDGRPGVGVLLFAVSGSELEKQVVKRVGQSVLTCPTTAVFGGLEGESQIGLGSKLRYFGDGYQISKVMGGRRYWRIPVMDGEFLCEAEVGRVKGIGGGNLLIMGETQEGTLRACERAVVAMRACGECILPFPGGMVRSGSKVGSKYRGMIASTNHTYCPTLRSVVESGVDPHCESVLEIVIDALTNEAMERAMRVGMEAVLACGAEFGVRRISAGNYGGKLGKHHYRLHTLLDGGE